MKKYFKYRKQNNLPVDEICEYKDYIEETYDKLKFSIDNIDQEYIDNYESLSDISFHLKQNI